MTENERTGVLPYMYEPETDEEESPAEETPIRINQDISERLFDTFMYLYIYIYAFYPKRLTVHSGYTFFFCLHVCSLGIEPTTFCAANAMLYH